MKIKIVLNMFLFCFCFFEIVSMEKGMIEAVKKFEENERIRRGLEKKESEQKAEEIQRQQEALEAEVAAAFKHEFEEMHREQEAEIRHIEEELEKARIWREGEIKKYKEKNKRKAEELAAAEVASKILEEPRKRAEEEMAAYEREIALMEKVQAEEREHKEKELESLLRQIAPKPVSRKNNISTILNDLKSKLTNLSREIAR